ncbi:MAG: cupin domain-containing protein [Bacteroidales bacterium]|nr:cupin domain-containing protein [Bacteroidales bacterium]MCF8386941.1 cupin domain-containing protein [Bacteroidales bacterium]MCF8397444.1 cupin domain-containing protein [Bacteroidales bacterium]
MANNIIIQKPFDIIKHQLDENGNYPNNPRLPLLIYLQAIELKSPDTERPIEDLLEKNNWKNAWRNGILTNHHFHSNTHEVLVVYSGKALVMFGGPKGPEEVLKAGDVALLPAGTTHKKIQDDNHFACIGAYPDGKAYNMHHGNPEELEEVKDKIKTVKVPELDPIYGEKGPIIKYWKE